MGAPPGAVSFDMLVRSLAASAAVHFGDAANHGSGARTPPNLQAAAQMIDLLALLEEKTRGNLTDPEVQCLAETLRAVRARLVEVHRAAAPPP